MNFSTSSRNPIRAFAFSSHRRFVKLVALLLAVSFSNHLHAQFAIATPTQEQEPDTKAKRFFNLPTQPNESLEAFEEFKKFSQQKMWDRCFKALKKLRETQKPGMLPDATDFYFPIDKRVRRALVELPAEGKDAYRLFFDAEAKKLLDQATGKDEFDKLTQIFSTHFICTVGDVAADRLGDLFFQRGELDRAIECWNEVLLFRPDSKIPKSLLNVKKGIAMFRLGNQAGFQEVARIVKERFAGEMVKIAGRDQKAEDVLAQLKASTSTASTANAPGPGSTEICDLDLPEKLEPIWQFRYYSPSDAVVQATSRRRWNGEDSGLSLQGIIPSSAVDEQRAYVSILGYVLAIDLKSGKLHWRTGRLQELAKKIQNSYYMSADGYSLNAVDGKLYCLSKAITEGYDRNTQMSFVCLDAANGKKIWAAADIKSYSGWTFTGDPVFHGGRMYINAIRHQNNIELGVICLDPKTGEQFWNTVVGTFQTNPNEMYYSRAMLPAIVIQQETLLVDSQCGAIASLDAETGALRWGFAYDSTAPNNEYYYGQAQMNYGQGKPLIAGGTMYFKGMRSSTLYALDLSGPSILWKRPVSAGSVLLSIDSDAIILTGDEMSAIDPKTKALKWFTQLPAGSQGKYAKHSPHRIYHFASASIFEHDKSTGNQTMIFRGADKSSIGGSIYLIPGGMLTVSNSAVTLYPRPENSKGNAAARSSN